METNKPVPLKVTDTTTSPNITKNPPETVEFNVTLIIMTERGSANASEVDIGALFDICTDIDYKVQEGEIDNYEITEIDSESASPGFIPTKKKKNRRFTLPHLSPYQPTIYSSRVSDRTTYQDSTPHKLYHFSFSPVKENYDVRCFKNIGGGGGG